MELQITKKNRLTVIDFGYEFEQDDLMNGYQLILEEFKKKNRDLKETLGDLFDSPNTILIKSKQHFDFEDDYNVKNNLFNLIESPVYFDYSCCYGAYIDQPLIFGCADDYDLDEMQWLIILNKNSPYKVDNKGTITTIAYIEQQHSTPMFAIIKFDMFRQSRAEFSSTL